MLLASLVTCNADPAWLLVVTELIVDSQKLTECRKSQKTSKPVIPAQAGIQSITDFVDSNILDPGPGLQRAGAGSAGVTTTLHISPGIFG
jgi:hypothetical protein